MKFLRSKRGIAAIAAVLLILFLWRPGVDKLGSRIAASIGNALGRRTTISNVRLRLLPRPGFDIEDLVIYDDPAFSPEPMIRAEEVSAAIRLRSLLRGRLEIANLSATEPSINLVRNEEGRWNLASLLARNSQIPAAPTAKSASERRPAFPYLEATSARVNFKIGQTKKSYALMDADVALWQDSDNSWAARIKAEPVRTDFNLTDTGVLQINATWQRAPSLQATPVQIAVQWQKGQLGQITKLLSGKDRGWRGSVDFTAKLSGTPEALRIESQAAIDDFHRYDIVNRENLRLAANCTGQYHAATGTLTDLACASPVNDGALRLRGTLALVAAAPAYDLTLQAEQVPLASIVPLLRQAKKQIPGDLTMSGLLNAEFHLASNAPLSGENARRGSSLPSQQPLWTGGGSATNVRLSSNSGKDELAIGEISLALVSAVSGNTNSGSQVTSHASPQAQLQKSEPEPADPHLRIGPVALSINRTAPVNAGGWISTTGYRLYLHGDVELQDLFRLGNVLALPVMHPAAEGAAKLDVSVSGPWQGFAPPVTLGTAQLRSVRAEMQGFYTPIEIGSASISLTPEAVLIQKIVAQTGGTHWSGTVTAPRHCAGPSYGSGSSTPSVTGIGSPCLFQFDLTTDQFSAGEIAEWFTPHPAQRPWYRILTSGVSSGNSPLLALQAHGNLHVGRFGVKKLTVTQIVTEAAIDRGKIKLTSLRGQLLQGTHKGTWVIEVATRDASPPHLRYHGTGTLHDISLAQLGTLVTAPWMAGTVDGNFDLNGSSDNPVSRNDTADNFREWMSHSDGTMQFTMQNGTFPHLEIPGERSPLLVRRFAGDLRLKQGAWELASGKLETREITYQVTGKASPDGEFDFTLKHGDDQSWALTGTFAKPHIANRSDRNDSEAAAKSLKP